MSDFEEIETDTIDEQPKAMKSKTPATTKTPMPTSMGNKKNLFFRSTVGPERSEKLSVGENTPVRDVKQTLSNLFGLSPDDFHLSHAGRTMSEDSPIHDYGVENGDEVLMIPHSTAGSDFDELDPETEAPPAPPAVKSKTPAASAKVTQPTNMKTPVSASSGNKKNLYFRSTVGPERSEKLSVGENTPVRDVKQTLSNLFGLSPDDFHLSHAGRTMSEDSPIRDYGVENGDEVLMIPHSTAGSDFDEMEPDDEETPPPPTTMKSKTPVSSSQMHGPPVTKSKTPAGTTTSSGKKKTIYFRSTVGPERSEKLSIGDNTPVREVKQTLSNLFDLSPDDFHLSHAGRTLNEDSPIGSYGIDNGDEVLMIPHSSAGIF